MSDEKDTDAIRRGYLSTLADWQGCVGPGWAGLLAELRVKLEFLSKVEECPLIVSQVKEKFGTLRFYATGTAIMQDCIDAAERQSEHTCEECGAHGRLRKGGWLKTLCGRCAHAEGKGISGWEAGQLGLSAGEYVTLDPGDV